MMKKINKNKKSDFHKNEKSNKIDEIDANKILVSKENHMALKIHLNTLLDTMIMMLSEHYA